MILKVTGLDCIQFHNQNKFLWNTIGLRSKNGDERGKCYYPIGSMTGWSLFMVNMKSVLENGYDLRNRNVDLKNVITA